MHKNSTTTATGLPKLSMFERARSRVFGNKNNPQPAGVSTAHHVANPALEMTKALAEERKILSFPQQTSERQSENMNPASSPPVHRSSVSAGPYAKTDTSQLIAGVVQKNDFFRKPKPEMAAELLVRGFKMDGDHRVVISRIKFDALTHSERNEIMAAGVNLFDEPTSPKTPTGVSSSRKMTFPMPPKKGRAWKQFMAFTAAQVKEFADITANKRTGVDSRQEWVDARASMSPGNWRYQNDGAEKQREAFRNKFIETSGHCNNFGPHSDTPNDPAPPVEPGAMTARDFVSLTGEALSQLKKIMEIGVLGRNSRAELKRAYREASAAQIIALEGMFKRELGLFPEEPV